MRPTEEILGWIAKERDYHRVIGERGRYRSLKAELEFAKGLLEQAIECCPDGDDYVGKPRQTLANMRRIAANFVRGLEKHGIPDQEMQLVRDCIVTITRK